MTRNIHDSTGQTATARRHILLVGARGTGKSTILRRLVEESPSATEVNNVDVIAACLRNTLTRPDGGLIVVEDAALMTVFAASVLAEVIDAGHIRCTIVLATETESVLPAVVAKHFTVVRIEDLNQRIKTRVRDEVPGDRWSDATTLEILRSAVRRTTAAQTPTTTISDGDLALSIRSIHERLVPILQDSLTFGGPLDDKHVTGIYRQVGALQGIFLGRLGYDVRRDRMGSLVISLSGDSPSNVALEHYRAATKEAIEFVAKCLH